MWFDNLNVNELTGNQTVSGDVLFLPKTRFYYD
jgi:hypothetical protein